MNQDQLDRHHDNLQRDWTEPTKYRTLADSIDEGFCVIESLFDAEGVAVDYRFLEVNPSFERQTGLSNAVGRTILEMAPTLEPFWIETYGRVATTGQSTRFEHQAEVLGRWYDVFAFRVGQPEDRWVAVLFNDASARVASRRALEEADERKNEFMSVLAHELRNPLHPMLSAVRLLDMRPDSPAVIEKARGILSRQIARMTALIDDLGDIGAISRGESSLQRTTFDLRETARHAVEVAEPAILARQHELSVTLPDLPVNFHGDANRLAQAVSNVLINAAKYTEPTGRISLTLKDEDDWGVFEIADNGIGMEAGQVGQVFDMFTQLSAGSRLAQGGLGIGLALVRQIVELHAGHVGAESEGVGLGSRFTIRVPLRSRAT